MGLLDWLFGGKLSQKAATSMTDADSPSGSRQPEPSVMPDAAELKTAIAEYQTFARLAFVPEVSAIEPGSPASKFGGAAWLLPGESWPRCGVCQAEMALFVQLHSENLPPEAEKPFGDGLLQLFHCVRYCGCNDWEGFGKNMLARRVPVIGLVKHEMPPTIDDRYGPKSIRGWDVRADHPNGDELRQLRPASPAAELIGTRDWENAVEGTDLETVPIQKDKLLGWPDWVQSVEYLDCPTCGQRMQYVFQIASEDNVPYMFGDCGVGHICICLEHPQHVSFRWACC